MALNEQQFYSIWEKFSVSDIIKELPDDVEKFCEDHEITVDYFIEEFMWESICPIRNYKGHMKILCVLYKILFGTYKNYAIL